MKTYRATSISIYADLMMQCVTDINSSAVRHRMPSIQIEPMPTANKLTEIVTFMFEYYLFRQLTYRFSNASGDFKSFESIYNTLSKSEYFSHVEQVFDTREGHALEYPNCVNTDRLLIARQAYHVSDTSPLVNKNKARDELFRKLRKCLKRVRQQFSASRVDFDFDDLDAKLFLISYYALDHKDKDQAYECILEAVKLESPRR